MLLKAAIQKNHIIFTIITHPSIKQQKLHSFDWQILFNVARSTLLYCIEVSLQF